MKFDVLKFMLNKIIGNANSICDSYEVKPDTQCYTDWYNSNDALITAFDELTEVLSCAFNFKPTFSLNESRRTIDIAYKGEIYERVDTVTLDNFGKYVLNLYNDFNTNNQ